MFFDYRRCAGCDSKDNIIIFLLVVVLGLIFISGIFLKGHTKLKREVWRLEEELEVCSYHLSCCEGQIGYQGGLINAFRHENSMLTQEVVNLEYKLNDFETNPVSWISKKYKSYNLEVTAYSPSVDECDDTPFIAASGKSVDDYTIAVSQNMLKSGWNFGDFVYIPDHHKFYKINDVMNKRFTKRVDIFKWTKEEARHFGFCDLDIYLIKEN